MMNSWNRSEKWPGSTPQSPVETCPATGHPVAGGRPGDVDDQGGHPHGGARLARQERPDDDSDPLATDQMRMPEKVRAPPSRRGSPR